MSERMYEGTRDRKGAYVYVVDEGGRRPLSIRLDLENKSPTGFDWGYGGSGPAQLALALLADATGDDERALRSAQAFKQRVVSTLPRARWSLTRSTVLLTLAAIERDGPRGRRFNANMQPKRGK